MKSFEFFGEPEQGQNREIAAALFAGFLVGTAALFGVQQVGEMVGPDTAVVCPQEGGAVMTPSKCR